MCKRFHLGITSISFVKTNYAPTELTHAVSYHTLWYKKQPSFWMAYCCIGKDAGGRSGNGQGDEGFDCQFTAGELYGIDQ